MNIGLYLGLVFLFPMSAFADVLMHGPSSKMTIWHTGVVKGSTVLYRRHCSRIIYSHHRANCGEEVAYLPVKQLDAPLSEEILPLLHKLSITFECKEGTLGGVCAELSEIAEVFDQLVGPYEKEQVESQVRLLEDELDKAIPKIRSKWAFSRLESWSRPTKISKQLEWLDQQVRGFWRSQYIRANQSLKPNFVRVPGKFGTFVWYLDGNGTNEHHRYRIIYQNLGDDDAVAPNDVDIRTKARIDIDRERLLVLSDGEVRRRKTGLLFELIEDQKDVQPIEFKKRAAMKILADGVR